MMKEYKVLYLDRYNNENEDTIWDSSKKRAVGYAAAYAAAVTDGKILVVAEADKFDAAVAEYRKQTAAKELKKVSAQAVRKVMSGRAGSLTPWELDAAADMIAEMQKMIEAAKAEYEAEEEGFESAAEYQAWKDRKSAEEKN